MAIWHSLRRFCWLVSFQSRFSFTQKRRVALTVGVWVVHVAIAQQSYLCKALNNITVPGACNAPNSMLFSTVRRHLRFEHAWAWWYECVSVWGVFWRGNNLPKRSKISSTDKFLHSQAMRAKPQGLHLAPFPDRSRLQYLIACSMQILEVEWRWNETLFWLRNNIYPGLPNVIRDETLGFCWKSPECSLWDLGTKLTQWCLSLIWQSQTLACGDQVPSLENSDCCFSKLFGYYRCVTILPMLIQRTQWTSGCRIFSGRLVNFAQVQCKFNQSWYLSKIHQIFWISLGRRVREYPSYAYLKGHGCSGSLMKYQLWLNLHIS